MDEKTLMRELMQTFQIEAEEHLETLNQSLLKLERQPEDSLQKTELVQEAFRTAHSLKGAARAVNLRAIEKLAHGMEDVLKCVRDDGLTLTADTCDVLYTTLDTIGKLLAGDEIPIDNLYSRLQEITDNQTGAEQTPTAENALHAPVPIEVENTRHPFAESEDTIRVAVSKLDALMAQAGELTSARISAEERANEMQSLRQKINGLSRYWRDLQTALTHMDADVASMRRVNDLLDQHHNYIQDIAHEVNAADVSTKRDALRLEMITNRLHDEMRRVRMIPFQTLDPILQRVTRDAARSVDKQVELLIKGGDVELDKKVLETLKDPFLHLLRNAVDHGIEDSTTRKQAGKVIQGRITIQVMQRGSEAHITITDDGAGFDLDALQKSARQRQMAAVIGQKEDVASLAFIPGVSTSSTVTELSGRGIGLDVVRQRIESLQGRIQVETQPGQGASIRLIVPVSMAMTRVLLVTAGGERFALPLQAVEKIVTPEKMFSVEGQTMLSVDERPLPLLPLATVLNLPEAANNSPLAIVIGVAEQRMAILVDDVITEQEITVKAFSHPLLRVRNLSGAALLGNGDPVIVLNTADIARSARGLRIKSIVKPVKQKDQTETPAPREHILVVDDSITTRTLEKNILEAAGFHVDTATDGLEAIRQLENNAISLVVADIEMPNMDGISLTRHLRESKDYSDMPIILVTSLESQQDRERGMLAGANAYIVKRGFNQAELLKTIKTLM